MTEQANCFLVLLLEGFTSLFNYLNNWWSLTPPFHPYLSKISGLFSAALSVNYLPGSYPALCSMESGLSSINRDYPFHILILLGYFIDLNKNLLFLLHHLKIVGQCTFELFYYLKLCVFLAPQKLLNKLLVCFLYRLRKLYLLFRIHL